MGNSQPKTCNICGSEFEKVFKTELHFHPRYFCCINLNPDRNSTILICKNNHIYKPNSLS